MADTNDGRHIAAIATNSFMNHLRILFGRGRQGSPLVSIGVLYWSSSILRVNVEPKNRTVLALHHADGLGKLSITRNDNNIALFVLPLEK